MTKSLLAGAMAVALASISAPPARGAGTDARHARAVVVRAAAPVSLGDARGDTSFRSAFAGRRWRVALAWRTDDRRTSLALAIASERAD